MPSGSTWTLLTCFFSSCASSTSCETSLTRVTPLSGVLFLSEQNATVDRLCHLPAQILASDVISAEVLPCVNTAQSRFLRRGGETSEVSRYSHEPLGANIERALLAEVKAQHGRARFTHCAL